MSAQSVMLDLGTPAPAFALPEFAGKLRTLDDFASSRALLVAFICNHCPYVLHIADVFAAFAKAYQPKGLAVVAINANDAAAYPEDAPEHMGAFANAHGFTFPYLYDEAQDVARAYRAVCTPDLFLFDGARRLVYRGQFDGTRPGRGAASGVELRAAVDAVLAGRAPSADQKPSIGCSIKWKPGRGPA